MKTLIQIFIAFLVLTMVGCGSPDKQANENKTSDILQSKTIEITQDFSDLAPCGSFTSASPDGGPTTRYFICRDFNDGTCYLKRNYFNEIPGCDNDYENNPYGKPECFEEGLNFYSIKGELLNNFTDNQANNCQIITQENFTSIVKE